jgi:membrane fusion protein, multidrug efflux system
VLNFLLYNRQCRPGMLVFSAAIMCLLASCQKPPAAPPPDRPPPAVTAAPVITRDIPIYLDEIGKCAAPEVVSIQPQVSGKITEVFFSEGSDLKKGDKLFTIDPLPFQAQLKQVNAELALNIASLEQSEASLKQHQAMLDQSKAELSQSESRMVLRRIEYERAEKLFQEKAGSKQDYDSKKMSLAVGEAEINAAKAAVTVVEAQVKQGQAAISMARAKILASEAAIASHQINLDYTSILSPIDGRAGQKLVDKGNVVNHTTHTPLLVLQSLDPLYVDFIVPERELSKVRTSLNNGHLKVECRLPDSADQPRGGEVFFIDNAVQESTGSCAQKLSTATTISGRDSL